MVQGRNFSQFGSQAQRDDLILRNVSVAPYTNPTNFESPDPTLYQKNLNKENK